MNTLRTTERSIFRLALRDMTKNKTKDDVTNKGRKKFSTTTSNKQWAKTKTVSNKNAKPRFNLFAKRMRLFQFEKNDIRSLTTLVKREFVPLINPNKPHPDVILEVASPIMPLSKPTFTKNKLDPIPSVTKVLQATMPASSRFLLDRWKESMIKKLGMAGFTKYQQDTFARGTALHSILAKYLMNKIEPSPHHAEEEVKEIVVNLWKSINHLVKEKLTNVRLIEHIVTHPELNYRGIVDCVAYYENELVVIDFKTAEKPKHTKESLYDNPLQITAYCGAINNDPLIPDMAIDRNICSGLIITAYTDGSPATLHQFSRDEINSYWTQWVDRLDQYLRLQAMTEQQNKVKPKKLKM